MASAIANNGKARRGAVGESVDVGVSAATTGCDAIAGGGDGTFATTGAEGFGVGAEVGDE